MNRITLLLGVHNHQPVGNFGQVFEELYDKAYAPFLKVLARHPRVKFAFHTTGPLLEWLQENRPHYLEQLYEMSIRGQVEFFSGGLYEPILPILPDRDKVGQIQAMNRYLESRFQKKPRGLWIAERVWEPHLPKFTAEAGLEYTPIDDAHFKAAGYSEQDTYGYYLTEEQNSVLKVFPISERMRYMVPFRQVNETLDYLRSVANEAGDRCVTLMDDGEKFGLWPETYKLIYDKGWLERLFTLIEQNSSWLETATFSSCANDSRGLVYLPTTSYHELSQWALPPAASHELESLYKSMPETTRKFLRGGYFRNFLSKYPESNHMYRNMLRVSNRVKESHAKGKEQALDRVWMSQCNCGYWHGVFGGLYLPHIRSANYRNMIIAEKLLGSHAPLASAVIISCVLVE